MLASKFFDDVYYNNAYYARVGGISNSEVNSLEMEMLRMISFSLFVSQEQYTEYRGSLYSHVQPEPVPALRASTSSSCAAATATTVSPSFFSVDYFAQEPAPTQTNTRLSAGGPWISWGCWKHRIVWAHSKQRRRHTGGCEWGKWGDPISRPVVRALPLRTITRALLSLALGLRSAAAILALSSTIPSQRTSRRYHNNGITIRHHPASHNPTQ
jgi:hypothetical protein